MKKIYLLLVFSLFTVLVHAQTRTIKGTVKDEKTGVPLIGAAVGQAGQSAKSPTDQNGSFTISVPNGAVTLQVTYIGYATKSVPVAAGQTSVAITLAESSNQMSEVVVTALGIKKDTRKLGYSVSTVGGDLLDKAKESNVAASLTGRVAGLNVGQSNGGPGSSARVLLRGVTSFSASSPLYVINGVPMDNTQRGAASEWGGADYGDGISNINPDDIETMTVLKGQAASALYGSRATNGVILITTKTGKKNSPFGVEINSNTQIDKAADNTDYQTLYGQGINGLKPTTADGARAAGSLSWGPRLDGSPTIQLDGNTYPYSAVKNNRLSFYRVAPTFTNTASFTGGNEKGSFRLSLSDARANSIVPNSYLDRKTFNFNGAQTIGSKLDVNLVANYVIENSNNRSGLSDGPGNPNNVQYLAPNQDQRILAPGTVAGGKELSFTDDVYVTNPYFAANNFVNKVNRKRLISSVSAKYSFLPWLFLQGRLGYDNTADQRLNIEPTGTAYRNDNGTINTRTTQINEFNADVLLNGKHDIVKDLLNVDLSLGGNIRKSRFDGTFINGNGGLTIPYFYSLTNFGSRTSGPVDEVSSKDVNSAYYSADFAFKNYFILSTTGRYDVYSAISSSVGRGIFSPSVSGSFIFSEIAKINGLDLGKIRISYAQTSNDAPAYANAVYYGLANSINGVPAGNFATQLPNLFLKPFRLKEVELGTEMKFWGDRLGFDVSYFSRRTSNEIINSTIDPSSGYNNAYIGTGSTQNRGIEVELHGSPVRNANFSWTPSFNFTYVKNKIVQTDPIANNPNIGFGTYRPLNASIALVVGLPGPQVMANDYVRDASGQIVVNSSGIPVQGALKPMGSVVPKFYGGFNNSFNYKKFNLAFLVDYRFGNKVLSATNYYSIFRGLNQITVDGRETGITTGVTETGAANTVNVPAQTYYQGLARNISALNVLDGSFIKLRQITLGYTFTGMERTPFSGIGVSLVARNLLTLLKHTDNIDPESGFSNDIRYAGIEGTSLPFTRTYGINLNFKLKN